MKKHAFLSLLAAALLTTACGGGQKESKGAAEQADTLSQVFEGDSTVYGLACDGCTDTILVFLPLEHIDSTPDTFNILRATKRHRILGHLRVGHRIAVVTNAQDSTVADFVIDMEELRGMWCYQVMPTVKMRADMQGKTQKELIRQLPDSIREKYMVPREMGIHLKGDHTARTIGSYRQSDEDAESPVEYARAKRYHQWRLYNGKLLLTETALDSLGNQHVTSIDTADFVMLDRDTLVLRFNKEVRGYYRKE
jgi:hypothetical protein